MRLRKKPWIEEAIKSFYGDLILCKNDLIQQQNYFKHFLQDEILCLELGSGRGKFLTELAKKNTHKKYLGVEKVKDVLFFAVQKAKEQQLSNVKFFAEDVNDIENFISEKSIDELYINFCDPWPKKRHAKKRLTNLTFLLRYKKILKENAVLFLKTDNLALFEFSLEQFKMAKMEILNVSYNWHQDMLKFKVDDVMTEYEEKFSKKGNNIYRIEARWLL